MTKLAYILAASHSGSTLLSMLLGAHGDTCTVGETKLSSTAIGDLDSYRCSCGEYIGDCGFWQQVKIGMADRGFEFEIADGRTNYLEIESAYARRLLRPLHRGPLLECVRDIALGLSLTWRKHLSAVQKQIVAYVSTVADIHRAQVVVDSSKTAVRLKYLLRNPDLDVKIVRLIRDGRAVALTYMDPAGFADAKDAKLRGGGSGRDREKERLSITQAATEWRRSNEEAEFVLNRLDRSKWIEVRYEEYCSDPDITLKRLFSFLGLDPEKRIKDFRKAKNHVIGNGMRMDTSSEVKLDERWRDALTEQDLKEFDKIAGVMNRRYGYQ